MSCDLPKLTTKCDVAGAYHRNNSSQFLADEIEPLLVMWQARITETTVAVGDESSRNPRITADTGKAAQAAQQRVLPML